MATATPDRKHHNLADDTRRVRSPLERLRGYIRSYVSLEGLAVALVFLALWFWIGLILDYGVFRVTSLFIPGGIDWVLVLPWWFRAVVLTGILAWLATLVVVKIAVRLLREFKDSSLALVLERRFPHLLGDRLITAVELSDPDKAAQYGYSRAMVRETIAEAAERVNQLPLNHVFDWKRLVRTGYLILLMTVVCYFLAVLGFGLVAQAREHQAVASGFGRFNDVSTIWVERNILLRNTIWPRDTFMRVIEPTVDELRIGRNAAAPTIRVRAYRYIVEDGKAPEGWRPLLWQDLNHRPELLGSDFVATSPPDDWTPRDPAGLTVDEIELRLNQFNVRKGDGKNGTTGWTIIDPAVSDDPRPLRWSDLQSEAMAGLGLPLLHPNWAQTMAGTLAISSGTPGPLAGFSHLATAHLNLPIDQIEAWLPTVKEGDGNDKDTVLAVKNLLNRLERFHHLRQMLDRLDERAGDLSFSRTLRKLNIPEVVTLAYNSNAKSVTKNLQPSARNAATGYEFTGGFTDLEPGSYGYYATANDYSTPRRFITVLPPPELASLLVEQERPAYLYYRPSSGKTNRDLRGKRQLFTGVDILERGGGISRFDDLPAGTSITLVGQANADLRSVVIKPTRDDSFRYPQPEVHGKTFSLRLEEVRREFDFQIIFTDKDGVVNQRQVILRPREDLAPELLDVQPDSIIRKNKEGTYIVSVKARIPFTGKVQDDNGLADLRYAFTLAKLDSASRINVAALLTLAGLPGFGTTEVNIPLVAALAVIGTEEARARPAGNNEVNLQKEVDVSASVLANRVERDKLMVRNVALRLLLPTMPGFNAMVLETENQPLPWTTVESMLPKAQSLAERRKLLKTFTLKSDNADNPERDPLGTDFALAPFNLQAPTEKDLQTRYRMQLWVEALDTDVESQINRTARIRGTGLYAGVPVAAANPLSLLIAPGLFQMAQADLDTPEPHLSPSKEKFTFLVVSETELLTEIAKEEEDLHVILKEVDRLLDEGERKLVRENDDLTSGSVKAANLGAASQRLDRILEVVLDKQQVKAKEVSDDYRRILEELRTNVVKETIVTKVRNTIVVPLETIAERDFPQTREAVLSFKNSLEAARAADTKEAIGLARGEGAKARAALLALREALRKVLESMQRLTDLNELIRQLRGIEEAEQIQADILKKIKDKREEEIINGATKD